MKIKINIKEIEKISAAFMFALFSMAGMIIGVFMAMHGAKDFGWQFWFGIILALICAPIMGCFYELFSQKIIDNKKLNK